ncbi:MAG: hypothetical protein GYA52_04060 [Chloroflexi bacterium]|nr:hypothetical protein [Chloroflexota bacterium]
MMELFLWVFVYLAIGLFVLVGLLAFGMDVEQRHVSTVMIFWPVILFYMLMLWIAEKRGPNDPCNH